MITRENRLKTHEKLNRTPRKSGLLAKAAIITCLGLAFTTTTAFADEDTNLETIYHVYVDHEYVGSVNSQDVVQDVVDSQIDDIAEDFEDLTITTGENISYISEKTFNPTYNNKEVMDALEDNLSIKAKAVELKIDDKTVGFFQDQKTIDTILKTYKTKFVDEKELKTLEKTTEAINKPKINKPDKEDSKLSVGDSIITDVSLSEKVSVSKQKVKPETILTKKQGVKLLEKGTLEENIHHVKKGEVLGSIASNYDLTTKKLLKLNPDLTDDSVLQIDQEMNVTDYEPFVEVVVTKEKMVEEKIPFETKTVESDDLYKGEEKIKQKGKKGKQEVHYAVELKNGKVDSKDTIDKDVIKEPVKKIIIKGTKVIPSRGTGNLIQPTNGGYISSNMGARWGSTHKGIDIARSASRTITAADNGVIVSAGYDGGYGNKITINHNNGMKTVYAHLSSIKVSVGQTVEKGHQIGVMGSTGNSTGIHLHFEVYQNGALQNPTKYF